MSRTVITCSPGDDIADVQELMKRHQIHRVPVVDPDGQPVGVLTLRDLARQGEGAGEQARLADAYAAISRPRHSTSMVVRAA